jgi:hypothetical protein
MYMAEHFSFENASGEFRIVQNAGELVPGRRYLYEGYGRVIRRGPLLVTISQFIMKFKELDGDTLIFDSPDFIREGAIEDQNGKAVLNPYEPFGEWVHFTPGVIPGKTLQVANMRHNDDIQLPDVRNRDTYRLFHLPAEAKLISPSIPPNKIEEAATDLAILKRERNLPSSVTAEITSYLGAAEPIIRAPGWGGVETPGNNVSSSSGGRKSKKGKSKKGKSKKSRKRKSKRSKKRLSKKLK